jgi:hypothetical protein
MKTTILAYVIAFGGVAMIVFGLWGLYILITERVGELRLRDYIPTTQTIAVGFALIGVAQALRLLLEIFGATMVKSGIRSCAGLQQAHATSNRVSEAAMRILKIRDQRLASEIGWLRRTHNVP